MKIISLLLLTSLSAVAAEYRLYFATPAYAAEIPSDRPYEASTYKPARFWLFVSASSADDFKQLPALVVDEYREFAGMRIPNPKSPNITFEAAEIRGDVSAPCEIRAIAQGSGGGEMAGFVDVSIEVGGARKQWATAKREAALLALEKKITEQESTERRADADRTFAPNKPGTYQVTAVFRSEVQGALIEFRSASIVLTLGERKPNKAPEPTTGTVTPRATP
ncbi:MAG: hypothetical protein RL077_3463 [Verrucomicrobiota bacterium]|jgi:hypothetical protein